MTKAKAKPEGDEDLIGNGPTGGDGRPLDKGDNGGPKIGGAGTVLAKKLKAFIERVERLTEEKKGIADDIREVFGEAKGQGFDTKIMKRVIKVRLMDKAKRAEEDALFDTYAHALGLL